MLEDKLLIWKVKCGDKDALHRIYDKYKDDMLTIAQTLLNKPEEAEDILHDVFVSFAKNIKGFHLYGSLKGYFATCVVNKVRDKFSSRMYQIVEVDRLRSLSNPGAPGFESVPDNERTELLAEALEQIPYQQREVIVLHLYGGMKFREIANSQDVSHNTAKDRYRYGLEKLKALLIGAASE